MTKTRFLLAALATSLALAATPAIAQQPGQTEWDGLVRAPSDNADLVFVAPNADFRPYTRVMIDPTEAAFKRNWVRDYNRDALTVSRRISESEARRMLEEVQSGLQDVFVQAYRDAGYEVATEPAPDVLRLRTGVMNITVSAPEQNTTGRTRSFSEGAGAATLVVEARDSMSGAILGRAVDSSTSCPAARNGAPCAGFS
jgi:hypothetical protein